MRERLLEEARRSRVTETGGAGYEFDGELLERKTKRETKLAALEEKYKETPKIAFH